MRAPITRTRSALSFNMTPMIDVVFQLIIFFLVASHLARQETQLTVDLPDAISGQRADEESPDIRRIVVNVVPTAGEGRVQVGGQILTLDELSGLIRYEADRSRRQLEVRIRSDRRVPYRNIEPIMLACAKSGVWNVSFAVTTEPHD